MTDHTMIAGRYEILAEIGRGGMGTVSRAYDHRLDTEVAIKVLLPDLAKDSGDKDSLMKEARVLARLTHPSIVRLFDLADTEAGLMLILEYVRGPNLVQVLQRRKRLTIPELLHVMRQICDGLAAAHSSGIIHRDLKPANILVAATVEDLESPELLLQATVKITDFGISKVLASRLQTAGLQTAGSPSSEITAIAGTPMYMAPEQFAGRGTTPATDIYALGVIAYVLLAGQPPFFSENMNELALQHQHAAARPLAECSSQINDVIQRAMAKAPEQRFPSAKEFFQALAQACQPPVPISPYVPDEPLLEPDPLDRAADWIHSHRWRIVLGTVALVAGCVTWLIVSPPFRPKVSQTEPQEAVLTSLGKLIQLPQDLGVAPVAKQLPPPRMGQPLAKHPGPHRMPHAVWTAWGDKSDRMGGGFLLGGVSPDGTAYIRNKSDKSIWAVSGSGVRWGFRAPEVASLASFGVHQAGWPSDGLLDFRDPGRVWLASCPAGEACRGAVFNGSGAGGIYERAAEPGRPALPAEDASVSSPFRESEDQTWRWPEDKARFVLNSNLETMMLTSLAHGWKVQLDDRPNQAIQTDGKLLVLTARNTLYSVDSGGHVEWSVTSQIPVHSMKALPSGMVVLLAGKEHERLTAIRAGIKSWEVTTPGWIREIGPVDSTGVIYLASVTAKLRFFALDANGKVIWSFLWTQWNSAAESIQLDDAGRLYLSNMRVSVHNKARPGLVCLTE